MITGYDLLVNLERAIGTADDPEVNWRFTQQTPLDIDQLTALYTGSGIAQRVCSLPGEMLAAAGLEVEPGDLEEVEEHYRLTTTLGTALTWARLYGGGGVLLEVVGDLDWSQPWTPAPGQRVRLHALSGLVLEPSWDHTHTRAWCEEEGLPAVWRPLARADRPRFWTVQSTAWRPGVLGRVHWTRILPLYGVRLPPGASAATAIAATWDAISCLQPARRALIGYHALQGDLRRLGGALGIWGAEMPGMEEMMVQQTRTEVEALVDAATARWQRNKFMVGPAGAKLTAQSLSLSGVAELTAFAKGDICATTGTSEQRVFGTAPAGLNTDGESWRMSERTQLLAHFEASGWRDACQQALTGLAIVEGLEPPAEIELGDVYETEAQEEARKREDEKATIELVKAGLLTVEEGRLRLDITTAPLAAADLRDDVLIALDAPDALPWMEAGLNARPDLTSRSGGAPQRWPHITLAHLADVPLARAQAIASAVQQQTAHLTMATATPSGWSILNGALVEMLQGAALWPLWLAAVAALDPAERAAQFFPWAPHLTLGWLPAGQTDMGKTPPLSQPIVARSIVVRWGAHLLATIPLASAPASL